MSQQLSLEFRPKSFKELVGQEKLIKRIHGYLKKRTPRRWLLVGDSGSGKTTLARIMALSFQCKHKEFGYPCKKCQKNRYSFDIREINSAEDTGKEAMQILLAEAEIYPKHGSIYRVYILDEFQRLSKHTQDMLLKKLEDSPKSTIYILCTSEADKVIKAIWRRVISESLDKLTEEGIKELVNRVLKFAEADENISAPKLSEALWENQITSSGFIVKAIEKCLAGADYDEAAIVEFTSTFNSKALTRALVKGDWNGVRKELGEANKEDARAIRASVSAYLSAILIDSEEMDTRTGAVAKAIHRMAESSGEDSIILSNVRASCFEICRIFGKYSR